MRSARSAAATALCAAVALGRLGGAEFLLGIGSGDCRDGSYATTVMVAVQNASDTIEEDYSGDEVHDYTTQCKYIQVNKRRAAFRFTGVDVPKGVSIYRAYFAFVVRRKNAFDLFSVSMRMHKVANSSAFEASPAFLKNMYYWNGTDAKVSYRPGMSGQGVCGPIETPDVSGLVQEIIDQEDWQSNNSMTVIFGDSSSPGAGDAGGFAYFGAGCGSGTCGMSTDARLHIEYCPQVSDLEAIHALAEEIGPEMFAQICWGVLGCWCLCCCLPVTLYNFLCPLCRCICRCIKSCCVSCCCCCCIKKKTFELHKWEEEATGVNLLWNMAFPKERGEDSKCKVTYEIRSEWGKKVCHWEYDEKALKRVEEWLDFKKVNVDAGEGQAHASAPEPDIEQPPPPPAVEAGGEPQQRCVQVLMEPKVEDQGPVFAYAKKGEPIEYFSRTLHTWLGGSVSDYAPALREGATNNNKHNNKTRDADQLRALSTTVMLSSSQYRYAVPLDELRPLLREGEDVEVLHLDSDGVAWAPARIKELMTRNPTQYGYIVEFPDQTLQRVKALHLRRRFSDGDRVSAYMGETAGWVPSVVVASGSEEEMEAKRDEARKVVDPAGARHEDFNVSDAWFEMEDPAKYKVGFGKHDRWPMVLTKATDAAEEAELVLLPSFLLRRAPPKEEAPPGAGSKAPVVAVMAEGGGDLAAAEVAAGAGEEAAAADSAEAEVVVAAAEDEAKAWLVASA